MTQENSLKLIHSWMFLFGFENFCGSKLIHHLIDGFGDFLFAILCDFCGNPCQDHGEFQESETDVTLQKFDFIIENMFSHVTVKSLAVVEHNFLMVGIEGWYHFGDDFKKLTGRQELRTDFSFEQDSQQTHHGQFLFQKTNFVPAEPKFGVVILGHVDFKQSLELFGVLSEMRNDLFIKEFLEIVVDFHSVLLLFGHDQFQVECSLVCSLIAGV